MRFVLVLLSSLVYSIMAWSGVLKKNLVTKNSNLVSVIKDCCCDIMRRHRSGSSEGFYQRALLAELYHRRIPALSEVDVFIMSRTVPVLVGRLDVEVQFDTLLELKVAPKITTKHVQQLLKYCRARESMGMRIRNAGVVCFCTEGDTVQFHFIGDDDGGSNNGTSRRNSTTNKNVHSSRFFGGRKLQ